MKMGKVKNHRISETYKLLRKVIAREFETGLLKIKANAVSKHAVLPYFPLATIRGKICTKKEIRKPFWF